MKDILTLIIIGFIFYISSKIVRYSLMRQVYFYRITFYTYEKYSKYIRQTLDFILSVLLVLILLKLGL